MNDLILRELMDEFPVIYSGQVELFDEHNNPHQFHILEAYNTLILVDYEGYFWMNEPEVARALEVNRVTLNTALTRFMNSRKGQRLGGIFKLKAPDAAGKIQLMNFYNEAAIAAAIIRMQDDMSEAALTFIEHREKIIMTFRRLMHKHILQLADQNDQLMEENRQLAEKVVSKKQEALIDAFDYLAALSHLHDTQVELEEAHRRAEAAEKALNQFEEADSEEN